MKIFKISIIFLYTILMVLNACDNQDRIFTNNNKPSAESISESSIQESTDTSNDDKGYKNAFIIINDEQKTIEVKDHIKMTDDNRVASPSTGFGGNIQFKIDNVLYDLCIGMVLEKDGSVYDFWDIN